MLAQNYLKFKKFKQLKTTLQDIEDTALQSLKEMRLMLFELRPLFFDNEGLVGALELRLNTVERRTGIETVMKTKNVELIKSPLDLEIYRIATEALNNSLKHSKAQIISISLAVNNNEVDMVINDDGDGFETNKENIGGIGFNGMRERAMRIGGKLEINSKIGSGTNIHLTVPILEPLALEED